MCLWKLMGLRTKPSKSRITFLSPSNICCTHQPESSTHPSAVSKQRWHTLFTSSNSNSSLMIKIKREAIYRINPFTNPGRKGAAEAASQRTLRNTGG